DVALTSVVVTPERAKTLDFTMPVADATQYYVVRNGETRIKSVADLAGKVVQYASFPEAYQDLSNGRLDYVINGVVNLTSLVHEHPDRFRMGTAVGAPTYAAWAVAKGNTTLLRYLNSLLARTRADGSLYALQRKWLGTTFESMPLSALSGN
ncbi:transporter substrate-binding domain-containing protein, partial [Burkholderia gladioli]|uniref:transporter substrate-binding domain-containing protein n=1 Tax=Burkholderia gladioli TaxID=28095 RepID=UPI0016402BD5